MKITKVIIYDVDYGRDFHCRQNPIIVKIETDEGIEGVGEVGLAYGDAAKAAIGMLKELASSYFIGADPRRIEYLWDTLFRKSFWGQGGGPVVYGAMSALDEALWDIKGKWLEVPVYELLGGKMWERIRLYANGWYAHLVEPREYSEKAQEVVADGYNALKFDPFAITRQGKYEFPRRFIDRDLAKLALARVRAVREAVGPDIDIMIEVHGNLGTTAAIEMGRLLEEFKPFFYEEPVDPLNVDALKKVSENVKIPIAGGERVYTRYGFRRFIESQALDIVQPDIGLVGGLTEAKKIAAYAETYNLHVQPHNCGGPVATAVAVQFDFCTTNFIIQEWFPYWADGRYNIITEPLEFLAKDGYFDISHIEGKPGLGVQLNEDYLERFNRIVID